MADQKKWFKVWASILTDMNFMNLTLEQVGRWTRLGALIAAEGENGKLQIIPPAPMVLRWFDVGDFDVLKSVLIGLPNVSIEECKNGHGAFFITMSKWFKYQVDYTHSERKRRARYKRRREEKRGEEKKKRGDIPPKPPVISFSKPTAQEVDAYAVSIGFKLNGSRFCDFYESKGWRVGNTPMKSWQAAVRTWKLKDREDKGYAHDDRPRDPHDTDLARRAIEAQGLRKADFTGPAGALLDRIRDQPVHEKQGQESNGSGKDKNGKPLV